MDNEIGTRTLAEEIHYIRSQSTSHEYSVTGDAAIEMLSAVGYDGASLDRVGEVISETVQTALMIAFLRAPRLIEVLGEGRKISTGTAPEVTHTGNCAGCKQLRINLAEAINRLDMPQALEIQRIITECEQEN
jgi:hypothetical protein